MTAQPQPGEPQRPASGRHALSEGFLCGAQPCPDDPIQLASDKQQAGEWGFGPSGDGPAPAAPEAPPAEDPAVGGFFPPRSWRADDGSASFFAKGLSVLWFTNSSRWANWIALCAVLVASCFTTTLFSGSRHTSGSLPDMTAGAFFLLLVVLGLVLELSLVMAPVKYWQFRRTARLWSRPGALWSTSFGADSFVLERPGERLVFAYSDVAESVRSMSGVVAFTSGGALRFGARELFPPAFFDHVRGLRKR